MFYICRNKRNIMDEFLKEFAKKQAKSLSELMAYQLSIVVRTENANIKLKQKLATCKRLNGCFAEYPTRFGLFYQSLN